MRGDVVGDRNEADEAEDVDCQLSLLGGRGLVRDSSPSTMT